LGAFLASSEVDICNDALITCGSERITSFNGTGKTQRLCNEQYARARDQLLVAHPWNFAIKRVFLSERSDLPTGWENNEDWTTSYNLPSDCLRVWKVNNNEEAWAVEGGYLLMNNGPASIQYISQITDTSKFSKSFERVLALDIALKIGYALTQSAAFMQSIQTLRDQAIREARSFDAQEMSAQEVDANDFLNSRF
jgi:hypothetical protein